MGKTKIHEIAKELGIASKDLIAKAKSLGIEAASHLSSVEDRDVEKIRKAYQGKLEKKADEVKNDKKEVKQDKKGPSTPVIIRREVIIADEELKKEEEKKKEQEKARTGVGFVERNQKNDFNIVYRNKPSKPMTVNELFGMGKKEKKKEEIPTPIEKAEEPKKEENVESNVTELKEGKKENMSGSVAAKQVENTNQNRDQDRKPNYENRDRSRYDSNNRPNNMNNNRFNNNNNNGYNNNRNNNYNNGENNGYNRNNNYNRDNNGYNNRNNNNNNGENNGYNNNRNNNYNRDNSNGYNNNRNNNYNGQNRYNNGQNNGNRNFENRQGNNNYRQDNQSGGYNNQNRYNNGNGYNRNNDGRNFENRDNRPNGGFNRQGYNNQNRERGPLSDRGIDKSIKDVMSVEIVEKEGQREYNARAIDKEKVNRFDDSKNKRATKSRKSENVQEYDTEKLKDLKQVDKLSHMFNDQEGGMLDYYDLSTARGKRGRRKPMRNEEERVKQKIFKLTEIVIPENISVKDLATELKKTSGEIIKKLFNFGIMATINNELDFDTAYLVAEEFGVSAVKKEIVKEEDILFDDSEDNDEELEKRPPVVVVMGHVDHGKTSLLDAVRSTNVIEGEAGGITQHIGAYKVTVAGREITFLDTPGHEAFTSMRARGAQITDIAILVVAADDGVMPQTVEAINHAKAAEIPIIVAVNKIDLPGANVEKIKQELMKYELVPEEWGGDTIYVPISAKKHINIDNLLEMVLLVADMKDLKANPKKQAKGVVIEARLDKEKGPIASVLVQRGTLDMGDAIVVGTSLGRIRAMKNDKGQKVKKAGPSTPVEIMGLTNVPEAGDTFYEVKDEKMAKHLIEKRKREEREKVMDTYNKVTLNNIFEKMANDDMKQLNIIVKTDVQGTAEALKQSLEKLSNEEVAVKVIHSNTGAVNESDINLAKAAKAIVIAFNVRPTVNAKAVAEKEGVEVKQYSIIYQALEDVEAAMKGMLDPVFEEKVIGNVEVRQTFKVSNVGTIAGGYVIDGRVERNAGVRVIREDVVIHEGKLESLKRFKDDVKEVAKGYECGLQIENYNDIKEGDIIEAFVMEEVKK